MNAAHKMNLESFYRPARPVGASWDSPILLVPYMWIGDFVRCHTVVKLLKERFPSRPIDVLTTTMVSPLLDYMPGVRKGIVVDLPRRNRSSTNARAAVIELAGSIELASAAAEAAKNWRGCDGVSTSSG